MSIHIQLFMLVLSVIQGLVLKVDVQKYLLHYFRYLEEHYFDIQSTKFACGKQIEHMRSADLAMQLCCNKPPVSIFLKLPVVQYIQSIGTFTRC